MRILLVKETRAGEKRVALLPSAVAKLIEQGHHVCVEAGAGQGTGFSDHDYEAVGAVIRPLTPEDGHRFFSGIDLIVRVKRASLEREQWEGQWLPQGAAMMAALDPYEHEGEHLTPLLNREMKLYSLDYLQVEAGHNLDILSKMSRLTGKLALEDAVARCARPVANVVIIGYGVAGQAALQAASHSRFVSTVFCTRSSQRDQIQSLGHNAIVINKSAPLEETQNDILRVIESADIVITAARSRESRSPQLVTLAMLQQMRSGAVVVDLAISDGGNVAGSVHDQDILLPNGVLVTNVSGYPKRVPEQASALWSDSMLECVMRYSELDPVIESARVGGLQ